MVTDEFSKGKSRNSPYTVNFRRLILAPKELVGYEKKRVGRIVMLGIQFLGRLHSHQN